MPLSVHNIQYKELREFSTEIEFIVACSRAEGHELVNIRLQNEDMANRFRTSAAKILRSMKKDGVIKLFVFENELSDTEKMESVYLLNKFPFLSEREVRLENSVYIKI